MLKWNPFIILNVDNNREAEKKDGLKKTVRDWGRFWLIEQNGVEAKG